MNTSEIWGMLKERFKVIRKSLASENHNQRLKYILSFQLLFIAANQIASFTRAQNSLVSQWQVPGFFWK